MTHTTTAFSFSEKEPGGPFERLWKVVFSQPQYATEGHYQILLNCQQVESGWTPCRPDLKSAIDIIESFKNRNK